MYAQPSRTLPDTNLRDLVALASDLPALLQAPTTTNRDRKELVRTLVQRVVIVERTPEHVVATIHWNDGVEATVLRVFWDAYAHRRIAELAAAGASIREMCMSLEQERLVTRSGNLWTANAVHMILRRKRIAYRPSAKGTGRRATVLERTAKRLPSSQNCVGSRGL